MEEIVVAVISGGLTLLGVLASNSRSKAVMSEQISELSDRVERHNKVVERVYNLETRQAANDERFKTLFSDVSELKEEVKHV